MPTVSLRLSDREFNMIQEYINANDLSVSAFIRDAILEKIENDYKFDEERILTAKAVAYNGKLYSFNEAWKEIGV